MENDNHPLRAGSGGVPSEHGWTWRRAGPADLPAVMRLEREGFPPEIVEEEAVFARRLEVFPEGFFLAERGPDLVGYWYGELWAPQDDWRSLPFGLRHDPAAVVDRQGSWLYIASLTLAPGERGRGAGDAFFWEGVERLAAVSGRVDTLWLVVHPEWQGARRIYEKRGFSLMGVLSGFFGLGQSGGLVYRRGFP